MAIADTDDLIARTKTIIGRATATGFLGESSVRHFVAETVLTAAALVLLEIYLGGFFKPLEQLGERHRKAASALLKRLQLGDVPTGDVELNSAAIHASLPQAASLDSPERRAAAEEEVRRILREHGESAAEAARKAAAISEAIFAR